MTTSIGSLQKVQATGPCSFERLEALLLDMREKLATHITDESKRLERLLLEQPRTFSTIGSSFGNVAPTTPSLIEEPSHVDNSHENGAGNVMMSSATNGLSHGPSGRVCFSVFDASCDPNNMRHSITPSSSSQGLVDRCLMLNRCVLHPLFDHTVSAIILLNAVFVCAQADYAARHPKDDEPLCLQRVETCFFIVFAAELLLRILALGWRFGSGPQRGWNLFDTVVVLTSGTEEIIKLTSSSLLHANLTFLRVMRLVKITRAMRIIRIVRVFRELRIMVLSILSTVRTLFWAMVCLLMLTSVVGVFLVTAVADHQAKSEEADADMEVYFGSMTSAVTSLFQATSNGIDWRLLSDILGKVSVLPQSMLYLYIGMMVFAIMNILTGICVNNANRAAEDDFEISMFEEISKRESVVVQLKRIFHDADTEKSGVIRWSQLKEKLQNPSTRTFFSKLDLEEWQLYSLFELLNLDGNEDPSISIDLFIRGCTRLRCQVKNVDLMAAVKDADKGHIHRQEALIHSLEQLRASLDRRHMQQSQRTQHIQQQRL